MGKRIETVDALLAQDGTGISWAHLTFNAWLGCQKVSPACDNCYADDLCRTRLGVIFGPGEERRRTAPSTWRKPLRWQAVAARNRVRLRVFGGSLMDWADNAAPDGARADLADLIRATPNLDWMMLTKRIGNAEAMLRAMFPEGVPPNVWLGVTVANQAEADRDIPRAIVVKERLGITRLFLSIEPMLGPVNIVPWLASIDLAIAGGESGKDARPMHPVWPLELGDQCWNAGVPFHFKQHGEFVDEDHHEVIPSMRPRFTFPDGTKMYRVGTKPAGRLLAGREWLEDMA